MEPRDYMEAAAESSNRTKLLFYALLAASVVAFTANWNSRKGTWLSHRLAAARTACMVLELREDFPSDSNFLFLENPAAMRQAIRERLKELRHSDGPDAQRAGRAALLCQFLAKAKLKDIERAVGLVHGLRMDRQRMADHLRDLETLYLQHARVAHMPILGLAFDVKDLGMISGISFTVLLVLLALSATREKDDLEKTFLKAERAGGREGLADCYQYMAARQVLAFPPSVDPDDPDEKISPATARALVKLMLFFPVFIIGLILKHEFDSIGEGYMVNGLSVQRVLAFTGLFAFVVTAFALAVSACLADVDRVWTRWREKILAPELPAQEIAPEPVPAPVPEAQAAAAPPEPEAAPPVQSAPIPPAQAAPEPASPEAIPPEPQPEGPEAAVQEAAPAMPQPEKALSLPLGAQPEAG